MAGFTHFRHSTNSRFDDKLKAFSESLGRKSKEGYFYYFTLIEMLAAQADEGQTEFKIHTATLRNLWSTSAANVRLVCAQCTASALLVCIERTNYVEISIPNLPKYLGSYSLKKERKERKKEINNTAESLVEKLTITFPEIKPLKKTRTKKSKPELSSSSPLEALYAPEYAQEAYSGWLRTGAAKLQQKLLDTYDHEYLREVIEKAYYWQLENKKRDAGTFLSSWVERDKEKKFKGGLKAGEHEFKKFMDGIAAEAAEKFPEV